MAAGKEEHQDVTPLSSAERWLRNLAIVIPCGLLVAYFFTGGFSNITDPKAMLLHGDFPAFYSAAKLIAYDSYKLYEFSLQHKLQQHFSLGGPGSFLPFAYPPYTAALLGPLTYFDFKTAKDVFVIFNALAFLAGALLLSRHFSIKWPSALSLTTILLCTAPLGVAVIGAQDSANTFFLLSCFVVGFSSPPSSKSDALAGYSAGFLLLKPQFALIPILALAAAGRKRALICVLALAGLWFYIGTLVLDLNWPSTWFTAAKEFSMMNFQSNAHQMISLHGSLFALARPLISSENFIYTLIALINFGVIGAALFFASRVQIYRDAILNSEELARWTAALLVMLTVILPPQTSFYDIAVFSIAIFALWKDNWRSLLLLVCWIATCTALALLRSESGIPFFGILAIGLTVLFLIHWLKLLNDTTSAHASTE